MPEPIRSVYADHVPDTVTDTPRKLDRIQSVDPGRMRFLISKRSSEVRRDPVSWFTSGVKLDQGTEGACVGFGFCNDLMASPAVVGQKTLAALGGGDANAAARQFYYAAKRIDEWAGENYDGTSVNAGARVMRQLGFIDSFWWCIDANGIIDALHDGPVVVGWNLRESMWNTRPSGLYEYHGSIIGGHCMVLTGYSPRRTIPGETGYFEVVKGRNSWGESWGRRGDFYMKVDDLQTIHTDGGEACVLVGRKSRPFGRTSAEGDTDG